MSPIEYGTSRLASLVRSIGWETLQDCLAFLEGEGLTRDEATLAVRACVDRPDCEASQDPHRGWILESAA